MIIEAALFTSVIVIVGAIVNPIKWRRDVLSHIAHSD